MLLILKLVLMLNKLLILRLVLMLNTLLILRLVLMLNTLLILRIVLLNLIRMAYFSDCQEELLLSCTLMLPVALLVFRMRATWVHF